MTWLNVVHFGDQEAKQAVDLMRRWAPIDIADALELLSPVFESEEVNHCCTFLVPPAGFVFDSFFLELLGRCLMIIVSVQVPQL